MFAPNSSGRRSSNEVSFGHCASASALGTVDASPYAPAMRSERSVNERSSGASSLVRSSCSASAVSMRSDSALAATGANGQRERPQLGRRRQREHRRDERLRGRGGSGAHVDRVDQAEVPRHDDVVEVRRDDAAEQRVLVPRHVRVAIGRRHALGDRLVERDQLAARVVRFLQSVGVDGPVRGRGVTRWLGHARHAPTLAPARCRAAPDS